MEERTKIHVGLDVHKDSISVAAAEPGRAPARLIGKLTHDLNKLVKVLAKIGKPEQLHIVYEAGPTGFGLQRALTEKGYTFNHFRNGIYSPWGTESRPMGATACSWRNAHAPDN